MSHSIFRTISSVILLIAITLVGKSGANKDQAQNLTYNHPIYLPIIMAASQDNVIYQSLNLSGHSVVAECNPGGGTQCDCSKNDVSLNTYNDYGEVISNPLNKHTFVNAIGFKKFTEVFPNNLPVALGPYKYSGEFRIPLIPSQNLNQSENAQAMHLMIQFWDGRNATYPANHTTLEGVIYWDLNPWELDYGHIKVYSGSLSLIDTGLVLKPDTDWHSFVLAIDLQTQSYKYVMIDGKYLTLTNIGLTKVSHPDWGSDLSISITTESLATWPQTTCTYAFTWTTQFRNIVFSSVP